MAKAQRRAWYKSRYHYKSFAPTKHGYRYDEPPDTKNYRALLFFNKKNREMTV